MSNPQGQAAGAAEVSEEDRVLDFTQQKREAILEALMPKGVAQVADPKMLALTLQTLDGMDRSALGKKRIKVEEQGNATQEAAAGIIAQLLQRTTSTKPFEVIDVASRQARPAPMLGTDVPPPRLVEGETATVAPQQSFESFTAGAPSIAEGQAGDE